METITPVNTYVYKLKLQLSFNLESIAALSVVSFAQCHHLKFCDGNFSRLLFFDRHGYVSLKASFPLSSRCDVSCFIIISWARQTFSITIGRYFHSKQVKQTQTNKKKNNNNNNKISIPVSNLLDVPLHLFYLYILQFKTGRASMI